MSVQSDVRDRIAKACTLAVETDGGAYQVTGRALPPDTVSPLDAWPVWQRTTFLNYCTQEVQWYVLVALPPASAETYIDLADAFTNALAQPLMHLGRIVAVTPTQITASDGNAPLPVLQFELIT